MLGVTAMIASHLAAVLLGVVVLRSLERRAVRAGLRLATRLAERAIRHVRRTVASRRGGPLTSFMQHDVRDADARRARLEARGRSRRGPPRMPAHTLAA
jgi:hypothetical protein